MQNQKGLSTTFNQAQQQQPTAEQVAYQRWKFEVEREARRAHGMGLT